MIPNYTSIRMLSREETDKILDAIHPPEETHRAVYVIISALIIVIIGGIVLWMI